MLELIGLSAVFYALFKVIKTINLSSTYRQTKATEPVQRLLSQHEYFLGDPMETGRLIVHNAWRKRPDLFEQKPYPHKAVSAIYALALHIKEIAPHHEDQKISNYYFIFSSFHAILFAAGTPDSPVFPEYTNKDNEMIAEAFYIYRTVVERATDNTRQTTT